MKLCTGLFFDGDPERFAARILDLEAAGVDMVLIPEIYGFDQVSVLGYIAAKTERIELMSGIVNVFSRSPALIAQSAATIDASAPVPTTSASGAAESWKRASSATFGTSSEGRLSMTNQPRSSNTSATPDRPAPDSPVISTTSATRPPYRSTPTPSAIARQSPSSHRAMSEPTAYGVLRSSQPATNRQR